MFKHRCLRIDWTTSADMHLGLILVQPPTRVLKKNRHGQPGLYSIAHSAAFSWTPNKNWNLNTLPRYCTGWKDTCFSTSMELVRNTIISYHIIPYHIISYHTISYRIISYHISAFLTSSAWSDSKAQHRGAAFSSSPTRPRPEPIRGHSWFAGVPLWVTFEWMT